MINKKALDIMICTKFVCMSIMLSDHVTNNFELRMVSSAKHLKDSTLRCGQHTTYSTSTYKNYEDESKILMYYNNY